MVEELLFVIRKYFVDLYRDNAFVEYKYVFDYKVMGSGLLILKGNNYCLKVINDKGEIYLEFACLSELDKSDEEQNWFVLETIMEFNGSTRSSQCKKDNDTIQEQMSKWNVIVKQSQEEIVKAVGEKNYEKNLTVMKNIDKKRINKIYEIFKRK